jgi:hypothetical protein
MRASVSAILGAACVLLGCGDPFPRRIEALEGAIRTPIMFVEGGTTQVEECPFPPELAESNQAGSDGRLRGFSFTGFSVSTAGVRNDEPVVFFPSSLGARNEELDSMQRFSEWSLRLQPPGNGLPGEDCELGGIVSGGSFPSHDDIVIPFGDAEYCVVSFAGLSSDGPEAACVGSRVGPREDWLRALEAVSGAQILGQ